MSDYDGRENRFYKPRLNEYQHYDFNFKPTYNANNTSKNKYSNQIKRSPSPLTRQDIKSYDDLDRNIDMSEFLTRSTDDIESLSKKNFKLMNIVNQLKAKLNNRVYQESKIQENFIAEKQMLVDELHKLGESHKFLEDYYNNQSSNKELVELRELLNTYRKNTKHIVGSYIEIFKLIYNIIAEKKFKTKAFYVIKDIMMDNLGQYKNVISDFQYDSFYSDLEKILANHQLIKSLKYSSVHASIPLDKLNSFKEKTLSPLKNYNNYELTSSNTNRDRIGTAYPNIKNVNDRQNSYVKRLKYSENKVPQVQGNNFRNIKQQNIVNDYIELSRNDEQRDNRDNFNVEKKTPTSRNGKKIQKNNSCSDMRNTNEIFINAGEYDVYNQSNLRYYNKYNEDRNLEYNKKVNNNNKLSNETYNKKEKEILNQNTSKEDFINEDDLKNENNYNTRQDKFQNENVKETIQFTKETNIKDIFSTENIQETEKIEKKQKSNNGYNLDLKQEQDFKSKYGLNFDYGNQDNQIIDYPNTGQIGL